MTTTLRSKAMQALLVLLFSVVTVFPAYAAKKPSPQEIKARDALAQRIEGVIVYARSGTVELVEIGVWERKSLGPGSAVRWGGDGRFVVVENKGEWFRVDVATGKRSRVPGEETGIAVKLAFDVVGERESLVYIDPRKGIVERDLATGKERLVFSAVNTYTGELGVSRDGSRFAARGRKKRGGKGTNTLFAMDAASKSDRVYVDPACSAGLSPDGQWLMNNGDNGNQTHGKMNVRRWDGSDRKVLTTLTAGKRAEWDNHHWSNHPQFIAGQLKVPGAKKQEACIIDIPENRCVRVTWVEGVSYPDLYVRRTKRSPQGMREHPVRQEAGVAAAIAMEPQKLTVEVVNVSDLPSDLDYQDAFVVLEAQIIAGANKGTVVGLLERVLTDGIRLPDNQRLQKGKSVELRVQNLEAFPKLQTVYQANDTDLLTEELLIVLPRP